MGLSTAPDWISRGQSMPTRDFAGGNCVAEMAGIDTVNLARQEPKLTVFAEPTPRKKPMSSKIRSYHRFVLPTRKRGVSCGQCGQGYHAFVHRPPDGIVQLADLDVCDDAMAYYVSTGIGLSILFKRAREISGRDRIARSWYSSPEKAIEVEHARLEDALAKFYEWHPKP